MFSEKDLVERSTEEMQAEIDSLKAESEDLRTRHAEALQRETELRRDSVDIRPTDPSLAEKLWQEAESLHEEAKEMMQLWMEKKLRASEIKHQLDIHAQIESLENYDDIWQKASRAGRR
jgi:cell division septum initiation protein DivIVA